MHPTAYRKLLDEVRDESNWLPARGLAGVSGALRDFIARWKQTAASLRQPPQTDSQQMVIIHRASGHDRLDDDLLHVGELSQPTRVKLRPGADLYNGTQLFGTGRRPGVFEQPARAVVVIEGIEYLTPHLFQRFRWYLQGWKSGGQSETPPFHILLLCANNSQDIDQNLAKLVPERELLQLPALQERKNDVPFCLQYEARLHNGGLGDFSPEAVSKLINHAWSGDLGELARVVSRLYRSRPERSSISPEMVTPALTSANENTLIVGTSVANWPTIWVELASLHKQCNRRANALIGMPFFGPGTADAAADPLWESDSPDLIFLQLVSWAYRKVVEEAEPNLKLVLEIHEDTFHGSREARQISEVIAKLRTYQQHRLEYGSDHDDLTRTAVQDWFRRACGDRVPEAWLIETCVSALLNDLKELFQTIGDILQRIEKDDMRELLVEQWKRKKETAWPKHRFVGLVTDVLRLLGRNEGPNALVAEAVTEKLLARMQQQLRAMVEGSENEQRIRSWVEKIVVSEYPETMPFDGRDLEKLGLQPGPAYRTILNKLQTEYDAKKCPREVLLELAKPLVEVHSQQSKVSNLPSSLTKNPDGG